MMAQLLVACSLSLINYFHLLPHTLLVYQLEYLLDKFRIYAQKHTYFVGTGSLIPNAVLPGYKLVNFRLGIEDSKAGWSLSANLKNAFNRTYYVGGEALGQLFQINMANPGDRRTISVEARYKF